MFCVLVRRRWSHRCHHQGTGLCKARERGHLLVLCWVQPKLCVPVVRRRTYHGGTKVVIHGHHYIRQNKVRQQTCLNSSRLNQDMSGGDSCFPPLCCLSVWLPVYLPDWNSAITTLRSIVPKVPTLFSSPLVCKKLLSVLLAPVCLCCCILQSWVNYIDQLPWSTCE